MKYQRTLLLSASCFLLALLCSILWGYQKDGNLSQRIAPQILRFHVLANSNSRRDQEIKIKVKTFILNELQECPADSKEALCSYINENRETLENHANAYLESLGCDYGTRIQITQAYFPTKSYGELVLPCGTYDAAQITLGEGRGRNWWCVLYPKLCFVNATHAVLPESSRQELQALLPEEDFQAVMEHPDRIHITSKLLEIIWHKNASENMEQPKEKELSMQD